MDIDVWLRGTGRARYPWTPLFARIDPEDLREIISVYQKCVAETVRPFGDRRNKSSTRCDGSPTSSNNW